MNIEKYYFIIAEGVTDCSLLEAILEKYMQYELFSNMKELPELFRKMIGKYPTEKGELKRTDSPVFYYKGSIGIVVKQANGCMNIASKVCAIIEVIDQLGIYDQIGGFILFEDTDERSKNEIKEKLQSELIKNGMEYTEEGIDAYNHLLNCKLYVFPNKGTGAIEKLLLECANISYKMPMKDANIFRKRVLEKDYEEIREECWAKDKNIQEFYADKVQFGVLSAVLKPDRPVRFSIKDKLIRKKYFDTYMQIEEFKAMYDFLNESLV